MEKKRRRLSKICGNVEMSNSLILNPRSGSLHLSSPYIKYDQEPLEGVVKDKVEQKAVMNNEEKALLLFDHGAVPLSAFCSSRGSRQQRSIRGEGFEFLG
ncbi:hypothetical protein PO124_28160 [Bacillus licheniformis]|nr:hypothetical protein [Bacillus licheniformis]